MAKVEGKFVLDNQGRLWPDYIFPPVMNRVQVVYPPELRFVDVVDGKQGITWMLAEDGRLFAIAVSIVPFMGGSKQLSSRHLTLYPGISGIVQLDINSGHISNAAILTRWN